MKSNVFLSAGNIQEPSFLGESNFMKDQRHCAAKKVCVVLMYIRIRFMDTHFTVFPALNSKF